MLKKAFIVAVVIFVAVGFFNDAVNNSVWADDNTSDQMKAQKKEFDAHRQYVRIHFNDDEMDFAAQWILGSTPLGGCEIGEAFRVMGEIEDGNPDSWQAEWEKMGKSTEKRAERSLKEGHTISARDAFMRASNYYRAAVISMLPDNPKLVELGNKSRECLKKAGELFDPPIEYFEIPFDGTVMPGYFWKADNSDKKKKTLIMIGGGETFIEDNFFYIAPEAVKRGYNFVTVDLPGQGLMPSKGQYFRSDCEVPMKEVLDYVLSRPEVDPEKIGVYGISGGGYFVPRTATVEKRIKAIAVNSAIVDQGEVFANMPIAKATKEVVDTWTPFKRQVTNTIAWRWGLDPDDIIGLVDVNKSFVYDPQEITCPALVLVGEGEFASDQIKKQIDRFYNNISTSKKKFVVTPAAQGASSHCIGENRSVMSQEIFEWFDEIFK